MQAVTLFLRRLQVYSHKPPLKGVKNACGKSLP